LHLHRRRRYALDGAIDASLGGRSHRPVVAALLALHIALHLRLLGWRRTHGRRRVWTALNDWRALACTFAMHLANPRPTH